MNQTTRNTAQCYDRREKIVFQHNTKDYSTCKEAPHPQYHVLAYAMPKRN